MIKKKRYIAFACALSFLITFTPFSGENNFKAYAQTQSKATIEETKGDFEVGRVYNGFKVLQKKDLPEMNEKAILFKHEKTGAKLFAILNEDNNKAFSVGFRTPVSNDKGIPHILEHCILLDGSDKYPVKQLVNEALKKYLVTDLNGETHGDMTHYPFASYNDKAYDNLMDIYLSSVFDSRFVKNEKVFKEEGWNYEIKDPKDEIKYNGVVLSEMKGATVLPERKLYRSINKSLFPDTIYKYESGGEPAEIPNLTFKEVKDYYNKYYSPSNSYMFLYGKLNLMEKLKFINDNYLSKSHRVFLNSKVEKQKPFNKQREYKEEYSLGKDEDIKNKTYISLNYGLTIEDPATLGVLGFAVNTLFNDPSSPLVGKLNEKGFTNVSAVVDTDTIQPSLSIMTVNTEESKKEEFINTVKEELGKVITKGIDKRQIQAGLNMQELQDRMAKVLDLGAGGTYGRVILKSMVYDRDPMMWLDNDSAINLLKDSLNTKYLEDLLKNNILDNKFSSVVIIKPNQGLQEQLDNKEKAKLENYKKSLKAEEIDKLVNMNKELKQWQQEPNSKEALATIKPLKLEELKPNADFLSTIDFKEEQGVSVLYHPCYTNGISMVNLFFDTTGVKQEQIPYISLLSALLGQVDTENYKADEFSKELNLNSTGIINLAVPMENFKNNSYTAKYSMSSNVLSENIPKLLKFMKEEIKYSKFDNKEQLKMLIGNIKNNNDMMLNTMPIGVPIERMASYLKESYNYGDAASGMKYRVFINDLYDNFDKRYEEIGKNLKEVSKLVFNKNNLTISLNIDEKDYNIFKDNLNILTDSLEKEKVTYNKYDFKPEKLNEGLTYEGNVQYNAQGFNYIKLGYKRSAKMNILSQIISQEYLWNKLRVDGGAYGGGILFDNTGMALVYSHNDPNLKETYEVFKGIPEFLKNLNMTEEQFTNYKITALNGYLMKVPEISKGSIATQYYFSGITKEDSERELQEILDCKFEDIKNYAEMFEKGLKEEYRCTLGNKNKIEVNKDLFKNIKPVE